MLESVTKMFAKQPEREAHQMTAEPQARQNVVAQQPAANQQMTTDQNQLNLRGGEAGEICCGICAACACFECCEICC